MSYKNLVGPPNWYALVESCIIVNHCVLLVRNHLKYVWFTKFTKFWGEVKNALLGYPKTKKSFRFRGGGKTPDHGLCPGPRWGVRPRPPSVPSAPKLPLHHWPAFVSDPHPHRVVVRRVWRGFVLNFHLLHLICWLIGTDMCKRRDCLNNYCTKYYTSHNSRGADSGPRAPLWD